jgi:hypothetical protein
MYINSFLYYITRGFYQSFTKSLSEQNTSNLIKGLTLITKILKINTILKIKLGFEEMLHQQINCSLWEYLRTKREKLDIEKYWMFDQCASFIREHAETVLFNSNDEEGLEDWPFGSLLKKSEEV